MLSLGESTAARKDVGLKEIDEEKIKNYAFIRRIN